MSIITRISTYASHASLMSNVNKTQASLYNGQAQLSSGLKTYEFAGMNGQVEQFVSLESKMRVTVNYQENNAQNVSRLKTTETALSQIIDKVDEIENLITARRNPATGNDIAFEQQMRAMMSSIASELNITYEGKYLFAGTKTNTQPVDPNLPAPFAEGVPDAGYYKGSNENVILRADDNVDMEVRIRADNPAFQKIFAAAHQALAGDAAEDDDTLVAALDLLQVGLEDAITVRATVQADVLAIENIAERQKSLQLYWKGVTEELANTDILAVSTQVSVDETVLSASFQAFATISQLRLSNYL